MYVCFLHIFLIYVAALLANTDEHIADTHRPTYIQTDRQTEEAKTLRRRFTGRNKNIALPETDVGWVQCRLIRASSRTHERHDTLTGELQWSCTAHTTTCSPGLASDVSGLPSLSPAQSFNHSTIIFLQAKTHIPGFFTGVNRSDCTPMGVRKVTAGAKRVS